MTDSSLFNHFIQDNEFTDLLRIDGLKPNQKIRCLSEKARVLVLLDRFQVLYSTLHAFISQLTVFQEAADLFAESSRLAKHNKSVMNGVLLRMNRDWGDCLTQLVRPSIELNFVLP